MKKMKEMYFILIAVMFLVGMSVYTTYAMFTAETVTTNTAVNMEVSASFSLDTSEVKLLTLPAGQSNYIELNLNNTTDETKDYELFYEVLNGDESSLQAGYSDATAYPVSGTLAPDQTKAVTVGFTNNGSEDLDLKLGASTSSLSDNQNAFTETITFSEPGPLGDIISTAYTNAAKTSVTNNGVSYQYATSVSMMTDTAGNIRYYGADPDNYIYFNCTDYTNQNDTTCEKWRIIGVFGNLVKIMRNESIGKHSWDSNAGIYYDYSYHYGNNQWGNYSGYNGAALMRLMNSGYTSQSANNSLYYTASKGNCYVGQGTNTTTCDFTTTGLKNDTTRNMIQSTTYYTAGYKTINIYSNQIYTYERGSLVGDSSNDGVSRKTSWSGKIALPYVSDYGYAADFRSCTVNLESYNNANCTSKNWMYALNSSSTSNMWLLTPRSGVQGNVMSVENSGEVYLYINCNSTLEVFPTLHISKTLVVDGTGDINKPYKLQLS